MEEKQFDPDNLQDQAERSVYIRQLLEAQQRDDPVAELELSHIALGRGPESFDRLITAARELETISP